MPLDECRDLFLETMGNQTSARCKEHDFPLVVSPHRSAKFCSFLCEDGSQCAKEKVAFQCPVQGCSSALCTEHHNSLSVMPGEQFQVPPANAGDTNVTAGAIQCHDSPGDEENDLMLGEETSSMENEDVVPADESPLVQDLVLDSDSVYSDTTENRNNFAVVTNPIDCGNANDAMDGDDVGFSEQEFPVTTNHQEPIKIQGDPKTISGCTILNNMGSLLVRRNDKLKGTKNQQFFLNRIVSTTPGRTIPLLCPEGMLFPSIFWKSENSDGSVLGAIPSGLLAHDSALRKHGIASMQSHLTSRITNTSIPTSSSVPHLCHAFDKILNLGCRHEDVRVVSHRGVAGSQTGIKVKGSDKNFFDTDSVDSRSTVNRLAAAVANKQATYFFTHTANMLEHFGLAPIKEWIDSDDAANMHCDETTSPADKEEIKQAIKQEAAVTLLRVWMEVSQLHMDHTTHSEERPLGSVDHIWWRFEFQDSVGNLPHTHALTWLKDNSMQSDVENRIRGSIASLIEPDEIDDLVAEGLLSSAGEEISVQELARRVLRHVCNSRCKRRVGIQNDELKCRVTDNAMESPDPRVHSTKEICVQHTAEAEEVLLEVGLFQLEKETGKLIPAIESLRATKHFPPSNVSDGVISPCNGRLFVATRSNQNLKIASGCLSSRHLAKHLALVDESNRVHAGAMSRDGNTLKLETEFLHNTKVTGSAIQEAKRDEARRDEHHPTGRAISHMEMICVVLGYDQVCTNIQFVHVPTVPLEERPGLERRKPIKKLQEEGVVPPHVNPSGPQDLNAGDVIPTYKVRNHEKGGELPAWRKFSNVEGLISRDQCPSPCSTDAVTVFGTRPPELRFVAQPKLHFRWFHRAHSPTKNFHKTLTDARNHIQKQLGKTSWVDGSNARVCVRPAAIPEILDYLRTGGKHGSRRSTKSFYPADVDMPVRKNGTPSETPFRETLGLFKFLCDNWQNPPRENTARKDRWEATKHNLIGPAEKGKPAQLPVIWHTSVKPTQSNRWLLHILLSMGEFDNEMNLLSTAGVKQSFMHAGSLNPDPQTHKEGVRKLTERHTAEQLVYSPGGTKSFDKYTVAAQKTLTDALLRDQLPLDGLPPALCTHLVCMADDKAKKHIEKSRSDLLRTTVQQTNGKKVLKEMPKTLTDFNNASQVVQTPWVPEFNKNDAQCEESRTEQLITLQEVGEKLDQCQSAQDAQTKNYVIVGGPGNGKTTALQMSALMSMARGLNTGLTANMSERAQQLGCDHMSRMFCTPVNRRASPCRLAELAISRILRCSMRLAHLQTLDVLFIDELGQISAELLSILDMILRRVRNSAACMGGVLVMATMDAAQLPPVQGRPPLLSPHMLTCFSFRELKHSVRAGLDPRLRRMQQMSRTPANEITSHMLTEFKNLVMNYCTFVRDWDDEKMQPGMLQMFGKKTPGRRAERRLLHSVIKKHGRNVLCSNALDYESSLEGDWQLALPATSKELSRHIKQPFQLAFHPGALHETTCNNSKCYSQAQVAILLDMPRAEDVKKMNPVKVLVAPHGDKSIPPELKTKEDFLKAGFKERSVGVAPERPQEIGLGFLAKRRQCGLKHRVASTMHAGMGQDLPGVASKIDGTNIDYKLWEKEQVVVLLSRTHFAKQIVFVGDKGKTAEALADLIMKRSQCSDYMNYVLRQLVHHNDEDREHKFAVDNPVYYPFLPKDTPSPNDDSGHVYIVGSTANDARGKISYTGQAKNIDERITTHNNRTGPSCTADKYLGKWALVACTCGFDSCPESGRQVIERIWQLERDRINNSRKIQGKPPLTTDEIADIGIEIVRNKKWKRYPDLQNKTLGFARCGRSSRFPKPAVQSNKS